MITMSSFKYAGLIISIIISLISCTHNKNYPTAFQPELAKAEATAPESVVFALGHARKAADAVQPALGPERLAASGDDLVGVGLVADIPDDLVLRGFEDIMQRRGQLHGPEARSQVPRVDRTLVDDIASQLVAVNAQLLRRELFQLPRRRDRIEQFIFFRRHKDCKDRKKNGGCQNRTACGAAKRPDRQKCRNDTKDRQ